MNLQKLRATVLITAQKLAEEITTEPTPVLLDVRWALPPAGTTYDGLSKYQAGHLPGAVFVNLETELSAPPTAAEGRHPLPELDAFTAAVRSWGVNTNSRVVVYDANNGISAARAWWLLRYFGVHNIRLLDGGLAAWQRIGLPIETGDRKNAPGDVTLTSGHLKTIDADEAAALATSTHGVLLDARAPERYRGEIEPIDPQAGHIPGAINAPTSINLTPDGAFAQPADLQQVYACCEMQTVGVYCGSGVTAAHNVLALASIGVEAALYPGSWSQWSNDSARPVATD